MVETWLLGHLDQAPPPGSPEAFAWLEQLLEWLQEADGGARMLRLQALEAAFAAQPEREIAFVAAISALRTVRLLAEAGLPEHGSLTGEVLRRLFAKLLPSLDREDDLLALLERLEPVAADAEWLEALPSECLARWGLRLNLAPADHREAVRLLGMRIAGLGLDHGLLALGDGTVGEPFLNLPSSVDAWAQAPDEAATQRVLALINQARSRVAGVNAHLDDRGVSTDLVFRLDLLSAKLDRLECLLETPDVRLAAGLVCGVAEGRSVIAFLRASSRRLARKIAEQTGETGEHYLVHDRRDFHALGLAAMGGGLLTAFTALFKVMVAGLGLAPGLEGLAQAANYGSSFLIMQFSHLALASKMPALTASSLAAALEREDGQAQEIALVAAICRGQVVTTLGNLAVALPAALLLDLGWQLVSGHPFLHAEKAAIALASLHPFHSWTIPFAAATGVLLWLSSLAAGWAGNWSAHRRLPEAVARSPRARRWLGRARAIRVAGLLEHHFSGTVGNLTLGLLLGFLPFLLSFLGLPLEVRHVTLSTATLGFAWGHQVAMGTVQIGPLIWAAVGVLIIGMLNIGVAFALSLRLAVQSRGLSAGGRKDLIWALVRALLRNPLRFLVPLNKEVP
ncbi:MAG: hypothetical protein IPN59_06255 [Holophaga sp.]|nr:hypothetical protein [Holophaga sp.]